MRTRLALITLLTAAILLSGCRAPGSAVPPSETPQPAANAACNELSFYLNPALGSGIECETIPESTNPEHPSYYVFVYPAHTELTIQNYPLVKTQFPPRIWVYPVSRFSELLPNILPPRIADLQKLIADRTWNGGVLPFLPAILEEQTFYSHIDFISFAGGRGVRFITQYSEGPNPISNQNIIYTFQGLTEDGRYWVAVTLPVNSPLLPASYDMLPEGYTQESLMLNYSSYVQDVKEALEAQAPDSFYPAIDSLDNLVKNITINP